MNTQANTFIIAREDRSVDPVKLIAEGLAIGRQPDCELVLNHPSVSRLHAGVKAQGGRFYIIHLSPSNSTTLNGQLVEEQAAIAAGDVVQIGPFFLHFEYDGVALSIRVVYQTAVRIGDADTQGESAPTEASGTYAPKSAAEIAAAAAPAPPPAPDAEAADALDVFWEKRKREAGKIARPSPLRPRTPPRLGKARFNWVPTRDLARPWPFAVFTWALLVIGLLSVVAAFAYAPAFSPAPISNPHQRASLNLTPAIAKQPNAGSCTSCHTLRASMDSNCAGCHQAAGFAATVTEPHRAAGVTCVSCHNEHKGADFRPGVAAISASFQPGGESDQTCVGCHNDANHKLFNGRRVFTPHGGSFGYPVTNGQWTWKGLDADEWEQKPDAIKQQWEQIKTLWPNTDDRQRRSAEFHALHIYRVRLVGSLVGNDAGEMSCSTCHQTTGVALDRETPRTTCSQCHNGRIDAQTQRVVLNNDVANCTSCHVQHVKDQRHWNPSLLTPVVVDVPQPTARDDSGSDDHALATAHETTIQLARARTRP